MRILFRKLKEKKKYKVFIPVKDRPLPPLIAMPVPRRGCGRLPPMSLYKYRIIKYNIFKHASYIKI
jgi:hypothetical protein